MSVRVRVEGLRDIEQTMKELKRASAKAVARKALKAGGKPIAEAGQSAAPYRTGDLQGSYGVGTRLTRRQRKKHRKGSDVEVFVGPGAKGAAQAVQTEFGNEHQAAQPHLRPAWNAEKQNALDIVAAELRVEVDKAVARARRRAARAAAR